VAAAGTLRAAVAAVAVAAVLVPAGPAAAQSAPAAMAQLAPAPPSGLAVVELRVAAGGLRIGRCNVLEVRVRNESPAASAPTRLRVSIVRPGTDATPVDLRWLPLPALATRQEQALTLRDLQVPEPGPWRLEARLERDPAASARSLELGSAPALCRN
jgi:hypothetical protein